MISTEEINKEENFDLNDSYHSEIDESESETVSKDENITKLIEFIKARNAPEVKNWVTKCVDLNSNLKKNKKGQFFYEGENPENDVPIIAAFEAFPVFNVEIIETLLNAGASAEVKFIFKRDYSGDKTNFDYTLLSRALDFITFDRRNDVKMAELLIKHGANPNRYCNYSHDNRGGTRTTQSTVLHKMIECQEVELVQILLRNGADPNQQYIDKLASSQSSYFLEKKCKPIHLAARIHDREKGVQIVKALHRAGANINQPIKYVDSLKSQNSGEAEFTKATIVEYPIHIAVMARNEYSLWYFLNNSTTLNRDRICDDKKSNLIGLVDLPHLRNGLFSIKEEEAKERESLVRELIKRTGKMYPVSEETKKRIIASFYCLKKLRRKFKSSLIISVFEFIDLGAFAR